MNYTKFHKGPIEGVSWGRFVINGKEHAKLSDGTVVGAGKDIILIGDDVVPWKDRKGHRLSKEMVRKVIEYKIDIVIIGNGFYGAVEVPPDVVEFLQLNGVREVIILKTPEACRKYNELYSRGKKVALLAHGTC